MMKKNSYSVTSINAYIKNMFKQDFLLRNLCIKGEVSNCKYHSTGHIYFTLKDDGGSLAAVLFAGNRKNLGFPMKDGDKVLVSGSIDIYERDGRYQLYAKEIQLDGEGNLYLKFLQLKKELEEMGMFHQEYKLPIPRYAKTVGVVTAHTGAAIRDILNVASRRNPYTQIILYPAKVQGDGAAESIVAGIRALSSHGVDVIIVGRGGGSIEDLWAFNEEIVARAVFDCTIPVISAVGHETDTTIIDYVADLRCPTPSAAAEIAVADYGEMNQRLLYFKMDLDQKIKGKLLESRNQLKYAQARLESRSPQSRINEYRQYQVNISDRFLHIMEQRIQKAKQELSELAVRMDGVSPAKKLSQGFALVTDHKDQRIHSISQVRTSEEICIHVSDGSMLAKIQEIRTLDQKEK